jgi:hypothetical protein
VIPSWDDDFAGRLGGAWTWANGSRVELAYWTLGTETEDSGSGSFGAGLGPPILDGATFTGDVVGFYSTTTELEASTIDVGWGIAHALTDRLALDWTLGVRRARFEETHAAVYDDGPAAGTVTSYEGHKSIEAEMIGVRAGLGASYRLGRFSVGGSAAFSMLDGDLIADSRLTATGTANSSLSASSASLDDDGRSGRITDIDARVTWHLASDAVRVWAGWEQSVWDDLPADPLRNFPGTVAPLQDRDSITFSSYKLGVRVRF